MLEAVVVETWRQHAGVGVTKLVNVSITTTRVEMIVAPNIDVFKRGVLIGFATKLGSKLGGNSIGRNLSQSLALPIATIGVAGILQMVFANLIIAIYGNRIANRPLMSSMVIGRYKSANAVYSKGRYQKPFAITTPTLDHREGHYVRPNKVALKCHEFKKDDDLDAHVIMFYSVIKANAKTS